MPARPFCSRKGGRRKRRRGAATAATAAAGRKGGTLGDSAPGCNLKRARASAPCSVRVGRSVCLSPSVPPCPHHSNSPRNQYSLTYSYHGDRSPVRSRPTTPPILIFSLMSTTLRQQGGGGGGDHQGAAKADGGGGIGQPAGPRPPIGMGWMNYATPPGEEQRTDGRKEGHQQWHFLPHSTADRADEERWQGAGRGVGERAGGRGVRAHGLALIPCRGRRFGVHIRGASNG